MGNKSFRQNRRKSNVRFDKLLRGDLGNKLTLYFLKSKHVKMLSEGDYVYRIRSLVRCIWLIPFYTFFFLLYSYYKFVTLKVYSSDINQLHILNMCVLLSGYHLVLLSGVLIYFLFKSMNKHVWIFSLIYNILFISEVLILFSICFLLKWTGILENVKNVKDLWVLFKKYWLFLLFYLFVLIILKPMHLIFRDIQMWTREWERIERFQDGRDKENAFIFKRWITPEEIKARAILKGTAIAGLILANIICIIDIFVKIDFSKISYFFLVFSYIVYIGAFVFPFNKWSLIYYWSTFLVVTIQLIYCFYQVQNNAWKSDQWYLYTYLYSIIPWIASLNSAIMYTWIIKDKPEIKAIVINQFETPEDFEDFVNEMEKDDKKLYASESVNEEKIDLSNDSI